VSIILFLNKSDLLEEKVHQGVCISNYFPEFGGDNLCLQDVQRFLVQKFESKRRSKGKPFFHHFTMAIDTNNIRNVFNDVKDTILHENLHNLMLQWDSQLLLPAFLSTFNKISSKNFRVGSILRIWCHLQDFCNFLTQLNMLLIKIVVDFSISWPFNLFNYLLLDLQILIFWPAWFLWCWLPYNQLSWFRKENISIKSCLNFQED